MIVGDGHQRIYGRKSSLGKCGINIRGRGRKLRINYRTTEQIRRFATAILEGVSIDDMDDGSDTTVGYRSLVNGDIPVLKGFENEQEEAVWVVDEIERLLQQGLESQDICVVGRTISQVKTVSHELTHRSHVVHNLSRESSDDSKIPGVRLANMHRVKGLEFKVVFLVGVRDGVMPLDFALNKSDDPVEKRSAEISERALLHVAGTRAVRGLYVTWSGKPSPFIVK